MKTKEELTVLKAEMESLNAKLCELTDDELTQVTGDVGPEIYVEFGDDWDKDDVRAEYIDRRR